MTLIWTPVSSTGDDRAYRVLELSNKLKAVIVSDPNTDRAAASLEVGVGQFQDPIALPGLAHFCEHMLFLGTEKFPDENSYSSFLSSHGGNSNAYTSSEETNYYFDVQHQYLAEALDRFSQFFIAPLFTESATSRELLAVHAEHSKNLQNDSWRQYQLEKSMANAAHPLSRFGTGCAETLRDEPARLGIDVRAALLEFHDRFYSSNLMTLAVVGRESLDELQRLVEELFGNVKNKQRVVEIEQVEPFSADSFQRLDYVVPVKDLRTLSLTWLCPSVKPFYHSKPSSILSNLIGHEASGSILSTLKEKGWATSMSAGTEHSFAQFSIFGVSVDLTEQGLMHCDEIAHIVYAYIALLRSPTATDSEFQRIFTEISDVARMNFEFKSKEKPMNYVSQLSNYLKLYAPTDVLTGSRLYPNFDLPLIRKFLDCLRPERCRMSVVAHAVADKCNLTERWYGVQYGVSKWTADQLALFSGAAPEHVPDLHIPHPNEFISTDFTIYAQPKSKSATCCSMDDSSAVPIHSFPSPPSLLSHDDRHRLWFKLDDVFCKPKLNVIIEIFSAHASSTPKSEVLTKLFSELLQDALNEFAYDAELAGLSYSLSSTTRSLKLHLGGYNSKLPVLADAICKKLMNFVVRDDRFAIYKEQLLRSYHNFDKEQPYQHAMYHLSLMLESDRYHRVDKINALQHASPDDLRAHLPELLRHLFIDVLAHGNMTASQATEFAQRLQSTLAAKPLHPTLRTDRRMVQLSPKEYVNARSGYNIDDPNSAVVVYWQAGRYSVEQRARLDLFAQIVQEPCFNQLRTQEQLGYLVWSGIQDDTQYHVLGFRVIVQSAERSALYLDQRIDAFIDSIDRLLSEMSEEQFSQFRDSAVSEKLEKDKNLSEESSRHWRRIEDGTLDFDRVAKVVTALQSLSKSDIIEFYQQFIRVGGAHRSKVSAQIFGKGHSLPSSSDNQLCVHVANEIEFRRSMPLFASAL